LFGRSVGLANLVFLVVVVVGNYDEQAQGLEKQVPESSRAFHRDDITGGATILILLIPQRQKVGVDDRVVWILLPDPPAARHGTPSFWAGP
jgi:hypothetical protein